MRIAHITILTFITFVLISSTASAQDNVAYVDSVSGEAVLQTDTESSRNLNKGDTLKAYDTVQTNKDGKLLVRWNNGQAVSLGELSSVFLSPSDQNLLRLDMLEGVIRLQRDRVPGAESANLSLNTPMASLQPDSVFDPIDLIVEVYEPSSTIVTVLNGRLRVRNLENNTERIINACQSVSVTKGKNGFDVASATPELTVVLLDQTTIEGTLQARSDYCGAPSAVAKPLPTSNYAPIQVEYIQEAEVLDFYPYEQITVIEPVAPDGEWFAVLPGIGRFAVPIPVGYTVTPDWVRSYAQYYFINQSINVNNIYIENLKIRKRELNNMFYVAQRTGNLSLAAQTRRELRDLDRRDRLASTRLDRLQQRVNRIENNPTFKQNSNLVNVVSNNINVPQNTEILKNYQDRIQKRLAGQTKLVDLGEKQIERIRSDMATERDPGKRAALRSQLAQIQSNLEQGKVPVPGDNKDISETVRQLNATEDIQKRNQLEEKLANELQNAPADRRERNLLSEKTVENLRDSLKNAKPRDQRDQSELSSRISQLQESIRSNPELAAGVGALAGTMLGRQLASPENRRNFVNNGDRRGSSSENDRLDNRSSTRDRNVRSSTERNLDRRERMSQAPQGAGRLLESERRNLQNLRNNAQGTNENRNRPNVDRAQSLRERADRLRDQFANAERDRRSIAPRTQRTDRTDVSAAPQSGWERAARERNRQPAFQNRTNEMNNRSDQNQLKQAREQARQNQLQAQRSQLRQSQMSQAREQARMRAQQQAQQQSQMRSRVEAQNQAQMRARQQSQRQSMENARSRQMQDSLKRMQSSRNTQGLRSFQQQAAAPQIRGGGRPDRGTRNADDIRKKFGR